MKPFSAQKYGALCQHSTGLSCRQRHHDPPGLLTTDELDEVLRFPLDTSGEKPAAESFRWLCEFSLLDVVGGLHLYIFPSF
jgi:hypothetical protein